MYLTSYVDGYNEHVLYTNLTFCNFLQGVRANVTIFAGLPYMAEYLERITIEGPMHLTMTSFVKDGGEREIAR